MFNKFNLYRDEYVGKIERDEWGGEIYILDKEKICKGIKKKELQLMNFMMTRLEYWSRPGADWDRFDSSTVCYIRHVNGETYISAYDNNDGSVLHPVKMGKCIELKRG